MELKEHRCTRCGGDLEKIAGGKWKCPYCATVFEDDSVQKNTQTVKDLLDERQQELLANLRRNLYDAVTAKYISSEAVLSACREIKKYLPDDFAANFYTVASGNNLKEITQYITHIDVREHYPDMDMVIEFLIRSLQSEFMLELNELIDRTYKQRDLKLYEHYATLLSEEAVKVQSGVYETNLPRDAFIAYSSKDMEHVFALVEELESQGISCFVALRNLRHGKGSVEHYNQALNEAIDNCTSFVFVSSPNSRNFGCDALKVELQYVKNRDISNAPPQFRNAYSSIPHAYKKPRVEYYIQESQRQNPADRVTVDFFDGYERVYTAEEVAMRIGTQILESMSVTEEPAPVTKYSAPAESPVGPGIHVHSYTEQVFESSCISKGYVLHKCNCGYEYKDSYSDLAPHKYGEWIETKRPTCTENGERQRQCSVCGSRETESIDAMGHKFGEWKPISKNGIEGRKRICRNCGFEDVDLQKFDSSKGSNIDGGKNKLKLNSEIDEVPEDPKPATEEDKSDKKPFSISDGKTERNGFYLASSWIVFLAFFALALFVYNGGAIWQLLGYITPFGRAAFTEIPNFKFALIAMTVCLSLAYLFQLFLNIGMMETTRFWPAFWINLLLYFGLWYLGYWACFLFVKIQSGFGFWTIVLCLVYAFLALVVSVMVAMGIEAHLPFDAERFDTKKEAIVFKKWVISNSCLWGGFFISWIGSAMIIFQHEPDSIIGIASNVVVPFAFLFVGALMALINGIKAAVYAGHKDHELDALLSISAYGKGVAITSLVLTVAIIALVVIFNPEELGISKALYLPGIIGYAAITLFQFISNRAANNNIMKNHI